MNKVKDVKKFLDNSLLMSQIHDCHVFRFHRFEGNIVIDVKEYSNSPWRRLEGNLISEITNQEISYVIPNYDSLKPFESSINRVIDDKIIEQYCSQNSARDKFNQKRHEPKLDF